MDTDAVAPRAHGFDGVAGLTEAELGAFQVFPGAFKPLQQRVQVGQHKRGRATQHVGAPRRQMELAPADVHPHIVQARHQVRVARQAQAHQIKRDGLALIRYPNVDVPELNDVAKILGGTVEGRHRGVIVHWFELPDLLRSTLARILVLASCLVHPDGKCLYPRQRR